MKYFLASVTFIGTFGISAAQPPVEHWDTYMAKFGDKAGVVLLDMGQLAAAPDLRYPNLVITGPQAHKCGKQDLPEQDEIEDLEGILDATNSFLTGVTAKVLVGTFTYNCKRLNYYYVKDTANIRNAIARMYGRSFKDYSYVVNIKHDPDWVTYRTFLYPNDETLNWMENDKIIAKMLHDGDSLEGQRDIHFDLYFRSDTDRKAFTEVATAKGYKIDRLIEPRSATDPYGLVVSKYGFVKMDFINPLTAELKKEVRKHHGFYNGWSSSSKKTK